MTVSTAVRVSPHHRTNLQVQVVFALWVLLILFVLGAVSLFAQAPETPVSTQTPLGISLPPIDTIQPQQAVLTPPALPEAPQPVSGQSLVSNQPLSASYSASVVSQRRSSTEAPLYARTIQPGDTAQPLSPRQEEILGLRNLYSPLSLMGVGIAAGYSHLTNGQPNYGTNRDAFAKRLGASLARDTSQGFFSDVLLAPRMHEDSRYYIEGPQRSPAHRLIYALTRTLVTRTNDGSESVNGSVLLGYAGAAVLTNAYYPSMNRNVGDTFRTYGSSLGGNALGNVAHEFSGDLLALVHLKRNGAE